MSDAPPTRRDGVVLRAEGVAVCRGGREVLHGVDLELRAGETVALLGPNGAGKSTLVGAIGGVLPLAGGTLERSGRVAVALQSADLAHRSALDNVALALAWWGVPRAQRRERALAALAALGAEHLAGRRADELSGGERRRVHLARALAVEPDVLVLDEPFAGLDPAARASLLDDTGAALRARSAAVLVVVHDRAEAWALADRLVVLMEGRVAAAGEPERLLERPPSPRVARFLGFTGELTAPDGGLILVRPSQVVVDPDGSLGGEVVRRVPVEDGVRLELRVREVNGADGVGSAAGGRLFAFIGFPGPDMGSVVRVRLTGGIRFDPAAEETDQRATPVPGASAQSVRP